MGAAQRTICAALLLTITIAGTVLLNSFASS
jgi:hypothetical protein